MSRLVQSLLLLILAAPGPVTAQEPARSDPTRPYRADPSMPAEGTAERRYELTAVLVSAKRRVAVVNGRLHREGDDLGGATLIRIEPGSIRIRRGGEERILRLNTERAATPVNHGDSAT